MAPIKARKGTKFVVTFTLPSGKKYLVGSENGKLSLLPSEGAPPGLEVLAFDDTIKARKWLDSFKISVGEDWNNWKDLCPAIGRISISP